MNEVLIEIELNNFRNYGREKRYFEPGINWITGVNGSGKTNLLEAILCLSQGKSYRVIRQDDMVKWKSDVARVRGRFLSDGKEDELEVNIWKVGAGGKKMSGKSYKVNGVGRLLRNYVGKMMSVWFGPEDLSLISGGSGRRRRYMDVILSQSDVTYGRFVREYEQALKRRNKLLELLALGKTGRQAFAYYDEILLSRGEYIHQVRQELVDYLNVYFESHENFGNLKLKYDHSVMSKERLIKYQYAEIEAGVTLIGPQRDDLNIVYVFGDERQSLRNFGSRGQQRMGALGLKLGELEFLTLRNGRRPILLLDDVLSELDEKHQKIVMKAMELQQTIVTGVNKV